MVQIMNSSSGKRAAVKLEVEESLEDQLGPLNKSCKLDYSLQTSQGGLYNPLEEPSPLGLRLKKSPSFLDMIQMKLSQQKTNMLSALSKKNHKASSNSNDKLKASNFPASLLKIGTWEYKSRYEGDLVGKCYFAKHKLVWEVLDGGLKNKIEIQWSDIVAIKANFPDDGPETLDVVLARQPLFFRETNPQPRKHTLWQATSDFTGGQASIHRRHLLKCNQGFLGKHFEKLIQCDHRLNFLSKEPELLLETPYFEPKVSTFEGLNELSKGLDIKADDGSKVLAVENVVSPSADLSSSLKNECRDFVGGPLEKFSKETHSSDSAMDTDTTEDIRSSITEEKGMLSQLDQIKVPGLRQSISLSDLVNHIGHCISEQMTSDSSIPSVNGQVRGDIPEGITQYLLGDSQFTSAVTDEQSLMSRVNSLCCLLQKDSGSAIGLQGKSNWVLDVNHEGSIDTSGSMYLRKTSESSHPYEENVSCFKEAPNMSRKDSVGELLFYLPRIASLPQFLHTIGEASSSEAR
ncbi:hypothetical protein K2173_009644 [Erythroxylum novogranatense]|uniref:TRF2/HOY1 PH-like domain-containing protein n=1 Tax=Erythroxylum novogranatense TaxID=1862640 RepID=A0AAV8U8Q2_9ROSI|nr:hypothetical protein K2173_009644 [Erythroxylum novogranatense]